MKIRDWAKGSKSSPKKRERKEEALQLAVADLLTLRRFFWCHVPNEGKRHGATGASLKRQGLRPGMPDVLIFNAPTKPLHAGAVGAAIELKIEPNRPTQSQIDCMYSLADLGWVVLVCYSLDDVIRFLDSLYIGGSP